MKNWYGYSTNIALGFFTIFLYFENYETRCFSIRATTEKSHNSRHTDTKETIRTEVGAPRAFLTPDMFMQMAMQNMDMVPPALQGPLLFLMGFTQQNMQNIMSSVRSLRRMLISSLVIMAVKRFFFSDLPTEADRNKANGITDAILGILNLID